MGDSVSVQVRESLPKTQQAAENLFWHARASMVRTCSTSPVCLVHLVSFIQPNKPDGLNRPNEQDRLADFFNSLLGASRLRTSQVIDGQQTEERQPFSFDLTPSILFLPIYDYQGMRHNQAGAPGSRNRLEKRAAAGEDIVYD